MSIRRSFAVSVCLFLLIPRGSLARQTTNTNANTQSQTAAVQAEMKAAVQQVERIVNQPVTKLARKPGMHVSVFKEGWFHPGASKPDFNKVDIRTSQEAPYEKYEYVTSDLNPGVVFIGRELEFNSMTKYFYVDRSLPKKRLTEPQMVEVNRLYRIIGRCEEQLDRLQNPQAASKLLDDTSGSAASGKRPRLLNPYLGGVLLLVVIALYFGLKKTTR